MSDKTSEPMRLDLTDVDLLDHLLGDEFDDGIASRPGALPRPERVPLSFSQELLWLLDRATPGLTAYNMPFARRLRGGVDVAALARALSVVVARHEALRTRFESVDGEPVQRIDPPAPVALDVVDLRAHPAAERLPMAADVVRERARRAFDLAREAPFRASVIRLADDDTVLLIETHHIVFDGWSTGLLFGELAEAYAATRAQREPALPALPFQFADHAVWQRDRLAGEHLASLLEYWRSRLDDATEPLALPTDRPRASVAGFAGARRSIVLDTAQVAAVRALAHRANATLYMTLLSAYMTVLHRYTGRSAILVGSGVAARTESDTEALIGYFNNTLVMRGDFGDDPTFAELLGRVRDHALGAYDHQEIPLEKLVLELRQGDERLSAAPLFEVVFTMQNTIATTQTLDDLAVEPFGVDLGATKFDLTLLATERDGEVGLVVQYRTDLFEAATIDRLLAHMRAVLLAAAAEPSLRVSAIPMLTDAEREQLGVCGRGAAMDASDASAVSLFEASVARVRDRAAIARENGDLTYASLDASANRLARHLRARGVGAGSIVGLALDRSPDAVLALLAIMKAGAAYAPLPPTLPAAALAARIEEGRMAVVVTAGTAATLPETVGVVRLDADAAAIEAESAAPLGLDIAPDALAYVLYTSGSTGVPKGVGVTHRNIVHYTRAVSRVLGDVPVQVSGDGLAALDGWHFGMTSSLGADLGNTALFPALAAGGTLHVLDEDTATAPARFTAYVERHPLDVLKVTPNHLRALLGGTSGAETARTLPTRWLVLGGEALALDLAAQLLETTGRTCRIVNHYGPTETTVGATTFDVTSDSLDRARVAGVATTPIGAPLANVRVSVRDARGTLLPTGIPGELYIAGDGVAQGYLNRPELTAERFVTVEQGERCYRTGDRVRWLADTGALEFLGRLDDQVKIRGYRVELREVEDALVAHPAVSQCAVALRTLREGDEPVLAAFVVREGAGYAAAHRSVSESDELRAWMADRLPVHMIPGVFAFVDRIPFTPSGKIDRAALPDVHTDGLAVGAVAIVAPRTPLEQALADIWSEVLRRDEIGVTQTFMELGGHSLLAIRVLGKLSKQFGVRLPLRTLFDAPTIEQLARVVAAEQESATAAAAPAITPRARDAHRIRMTPSAPDGGHGTGGPG